jgi:hypothetical protein
MTTRILSLTLAAFATAGAQQPGTESGREIAQKAQTAIYGFKTLAVSGEMTLRRGAEVIGQRTIAVEMIEQESGDGYDQARVTINAPSALKDTRVLSWSRAKGDDQQWLVTPRTGRVQKIAERGRQAAFVSSDFSYEDILKWQVDAYDYTRAGDQKCDEDRCTVVDAKPRNRYSNYSLLKVYFDDRYRIRRIDYYVDRTDKPRKTLVQTDYVQCSGTWQPSRSVITDTEKDTSTAIVWSGYHLNMPVDRRIMSPNTVNP